VIVDDIQGTKKMLITGIERRKDNVTQQYTINITSALACYERLLKIVLQSL
jgi:hypothetical protein